ncbi:MAG: hypothetical protein OXF75_03960 [Acidimicrobiaceae bacterium]|nr:hypothetical protein [Acidimicrobiaceae bacterium]
MVSRTGRTGLDEPDLVDRAQLITFLYRCNNQANKGEDARGNAITVPTHTASSVLGI